MHRVLVDTSVLIDLVSRTRPQHETAREAAVGLLGSSRFEGVVLASSFKDVYCVYRRHYGDEPGARRAVRLLRDMFSVLNLGVRDVDAALDSDEPDFEDGIIRAVGEAARCDLLLTRDAAGFVNSGMRKVDAAELAALVAVE